VELDLSKIVVTENLSLGGVMQAPGRADKDLSGRLSKAAGTPSAPRLFFETQSR